MKQDQAKEEEQATIVLPPHGVPELAARASK
jgi:hypothetical protein